MEQHANSSETERTVFVHDIDTATCAFCPYGSEHRPGDRITIHDEKTAFARQPREKLVEVTAVKIFRSTGRRVTLDLVMASDGESKKIAEDSDVSMDVLLHHRAGTQNFDRKHPPVVIYFAGIG